MQIRYIQAGGVRTRVCEIGSGTPLMLLHPIGFSADVWLHNFTALGAQASVCAPDLLGHGYTDFHDAQGRLYIGAMLEHLTDLCDTLGWDHFDLIGSSFGAQLAALMALRMPHRVRRLVIVGSATTVQTPEEVSATLRRTLANGGSAFDKPTWESCQQRLANLCYSDHVDGSELMLSQLTAYAREGAADAYKALLSSLLNPATSEPFYVYDKLGHIEAATLLIWGKQDPRASYERAREAVTTFRKAQLEALDECGHLPFLEHPRRFNELVCQFLAKA
ncbi:alpha/beta fold hydrolase [Pusillimonas sp.]|uniref:alpha/beta fold hydrolase n=1 Tax=Pusillimonas sp. TaxID=3040095 RepID=UPI0037C69FA1